MHLTAASQLKEIVFGSYCAKYLISDAKIIHCLKKTLGYYLT